MAGRAFSIFAGVLFAAPVVLLRPAVVGIEAFLADATFTVLFNLPRGTTVMGVSRQAPHLPFLAIVIAWAIPSIFRFVLTSFLISLSGSFFRRERRFGGRFQPCR